MRKILFDRDHHLLKNSNSLHNTYLPWYYILFSHSELPKIYKISRLLIYSTNNIVNLMAVVKLKNRNRICYVQPYNMRQKKVKLRIRTKINTPSAKTGHQLHCTQNWPYQSEAIGHSSYNRIPWSPKDLYSPPRADQIEITLFTYRPLQ